MDASANPPPRWATGHRAGLSYHRRMLDDPTRMDAFERAIRALVRPGDVILDLGAGTGVLSVLAARRGAARVHAVESMPVAGLARAIALHNDVADRIVVHHADAISLDPVEPVDLVIGDFLGCYLVDDGMLPAVAAAGRWLKPGGRFAPSRIALDLAPAGNLYFEDIDAFRFWIYGIDYGPAVSQALGSCYRADVRRDMLLGAPVRHLELVLPDVGVSFDRDFTFAIDRPGELRAIAGWFTATLAPGVTLTNAPGVDTHWGQHLFPISPTRVEPGDVLSARIALLDQGQDLDWRWSAEVSRNGEIVAPFDDRTAPLERGAGRESVLEANERGGVCFTAGRLREALAAWEEAVRLLTPADDDLAAPIYENLGLALVNIGRDLQAMRAFLRALDGDLTSREQSLRFLVTCATRAGRSADAARYRELYVQTFGPLPG